MDVTVSTIRRDLMKFKFRVLHSDKLEPTLVVESKDPDKVRQEISSVLDELLDDSSSVVGLFITKS